MEKKIYKIINTALIFTLTGAFLCQSVIYASGISHIRVPVGMNKHGLSSRFRLVCELLLERQSAYAEDYKKEKEEAPVSAKLKSALKRRKGRLTELLKDILQPLAELNRGEITVESVRRLFEPKIEKLIYDHIDDIRDVVILQSIWSGDEESFLSYVGLYRDSPDRALCEPLSECLYKALVLLGFEGEEVIGLQHLRPKGESFSSHRFLKLKGGDGWIALDLATSMYIDINIRHVVIDEFETHRKKIQECVDRNATDEAKETWRAKVAPLREIFYSFIKVNRSDIDYSIEIPLLTKSIFQIAESLKNTINKML